MLDTNLTHADVETYVRGWAPVGCDSEDCLAEAAEKVAPVRFEATPEYMVDSFMPCRIKHYFPDAKLVMLMRQPVGRILSWYRMSLLAARNHGLKLPSWGPLADEVAREIRRLSKQQCTWLGRDILLKRTWGECFGCSIRSPVSK